MQRKFEHIVKGCILLFVCIISFANEKDEKPNGCHGVTLCHSNYINDSNRLFIDLGFMYSQAKVTGSEYAHTNNTSQTWIAPVRGTLLAPKLEANWGIVAAVGYYFKHDDWLTRCSLNYITFETKECSACKCDDEPYFVPDCMWCQDIYGFTPSNANPAFTLEEPFVALNIEYLMLEKILSRGSYVSKHLSIEPSFGINTAWLKFSEKICFKRVQAYTNCCTRNETLEPYWVDLKRVVKSEFWGIGPRIGLDTAYNLFQEPLGCPTLFNFFADFNAALLVGRTKSSEEQDLDKTTIVKIQNDYSTLSPVIRLIIGVSFNGSYNSNKQFLTTRIGWDNCTYFNQFTTNCFTGICSLKTHENNTFSMSGLIVDFTYSF